MKRRLWCLFASVLMLAGCAAPGDELFYSTQERVCADGEAWQAYEFADRARDTGIVIPGLKQNFVPQGIACWEERGWLLISGYYLPLAGTGSAALLAVDGGTGKLVGEYTLIDGTGRELGGHFSGVAVTDNDVFITGGYSLYRIPLRELSRVGAKGALHVAQELPVGVSADACCYSGQVLWVCEYYQADKYPLKGEHVTLCADGTKQYAWMVGYTVTEQGLEPACVFSVPDKVQGVTALEDGRLFFSQSYGRRNPSRLALYRDPRGSEADGYVSLEGRAVPMWQLDSRNLLESMSAPPMAEGCCRAGEGAYLLFESAAYYYRCLDPDNRSLHPTDTLWYVDMK